MGEGGNNNAQRRTEFEYGVKWIQSLVVAPEPLEMHEQTNANDDQAKRDRMCAKDLQQEPPSDRLEVLAL